jgi:hypothetical protein
MRYDGTDTGIFYLLFPSETTVRSFIILSLQEGVSEDSHRYGNWLRNHGLHWLLRQAHPHSHQQHHCGSLAEVSSQTLTYTE